MSLKWDKRYLELAKFISEWSKDPSTKTGCVIVSKDNRVISTGYNGFPEGVSDDPLLYENRETKYKLIEHCDRNSIFSAARHGISLSGSTMYLTAAPCHECTRGIVQSGIIRVVWPRKNKIEDSGRWTESVLCAENIMSQAGVTFERID